MIYKLMVNAAFLAIGYYIGKEVGRSERERTTPVKRRESATITADTRPSDSPADRPEQ